MLVNDLLTSSHFSTYKSSFSQFFPHFPPFFPTFYRYQEIPSKSPCQDEDAVAVTAPPPRCAFFSAEKWVIWHRSCGHFKWYPAWLCQNSDIENGPVEIVDFPSYKMDLSIVMYVYQRVFCLVSHKDHAIWWDCLACNIWCPIGDRPWEPKFGDFRRVKHLSVCPKWCFN